MLLIGIDRPQSQNLLDARILLGLGKAYYQLERDDGLRVAVLYGLGGDFSVGVDLASLAAAQAAGTFPPKDEFINSFDGAEQCVAAGYALSAFCATTARK